MCENLNDTRYDPTMRLTSGNPCTQPRDQYPPANPANHLRCSDLAAEL